MSIPLSGVGLLPIFDGSFGLGVRPSGERCSDARSTAIESTANRCDLTRRHLTVD